MSQGAPTTVCVVFVKHESQLHPKNCGAKIADYLGLIDSHLEKEIMG